MTRIFYLLLISFALFSCNNDNSKEIEKIEEETIHLVEEKVVETDTLYESLKNLLANNQPIYGDYLFLESEESIQSSLHDHAILQESDDYIFIQSTNGGTDIRHHYLVSFSNKSGVCIDFLHIGMETEGVEPYKVNWKSNTSFSTVDYQYELIEDEESGAYMKGELLDSTVQNYTIAPSGTIISEKPNKP